MKNSGRFQLSYQAKSTKNNYWIKHHAINLSHILLSERVFLLISTYGDFTSHSPYFSCLDYNV